MVTKEKLETNLAALNQQIEQSAANHNVLIGARAQIQNLLAETFEAEVEAKRELESAQES